MTRPESGDRVTDRITGYVGIVIGHADYADGRHQSLVQAEKLDPNGALRPAAWFDDNRLTVTELAAATLGQYI